MADSFHDVDMDLSKNALEEEDRAEELEEGYGDDESSDEFEDESPALEEGLTDLLDGEELDGDWDDGEDLGDF